MLNPLPNPLRCKDFIKTAGSLSEFILAHGNEDIEKTLKHIRTDFQKYRCSRGTKYINVADEVFFWREGQVNWRYDWDDHNYTEIGYSEQGTKYLIEGTRTAVFDEDVLYVLYAVFEDTCYAVDRLTKFPRELIVADMWDFGPGW